MTDFENILVRLQKGESIETIGEAFAEAMNQAFQKYQKDQEANKVEAKKIGILQEMVKLMDEYVETAKPDVCQEYRETMTDVNYEDLMKQIDSLLDVAVGLRDLQKLSFPSREEKNGHLRLQVSDADAVLKEFLSKLK